MLFRVTSSARWSRTNAVFALLACALTLPLADHGEGSDSWSIVQIEEDWELVVLTPDTGNNSPQVTCAMSPAGSDDADYMSFELNNQSQPDYATGGLHLHAWDGPYVRGSVHTQAAVPLQQSDETIRWTQTMALSNGLLTYEIKNGESETWGSFGNGELRLVVTTGLTNLSAYTVQQSLTGSGVGYGANRVESFVLKRVRFVIQTGQVFEFTVNHDLLSQDPDA